MALNEEGRLVRPEQLAKVIEWEKLEGVVVLGLGKDGEENILSMSTISVNELAMLNAQLTAHLNCLLGPMKEI